jgi:RNA polymerase sigma-70 factor (ECF subfamily)
MDGEAAAGALVERLFRREYGRITAALTRLVGSARLDFAEDAAQETLLRALRAWSVGRLPDDPVAWLYAVARRVAIDSARRDMTLARKSAAIERELFAGQGQPEARYASELDDDELRLLFMCAHPDLTPDMRLALMLKAGCGLSVPEIAAGLLREAASVAQLLVRGKKRIRERGLALTIPDSGALASRLGPVLDAIYLAFTEGHTAAAGTPLLRTDICAEAVRLADLVASHPVIGRPEAKALAARLLLQAARLRARVDTAGDPVLLEQQDRTLWDRGLIARGFARLAAAASGDRLSEYHLLAAIAADHARAATFAETDWASIRTYYGLLVRVAPSPLHRLNRAVALAMPDRPEQGLAELDVLAGEPALARFHTLYTVRGDLLRRAGRSAEASAAFARAYALAPNDSVRRFLSRRLN